MHFTMFLLTLVITEFQEKINFNHTTDVRPQVRSNQNYAVK